MWPWTSRAQDPAVDENSCPSTKMMAGTVPDQVIVTVAVLVLVTFPAKTWEVPALVTPARLEPHVDQVTLLLARAVAKTVLLIPLLTSSRIRAPTAPGVSENDEADAWRNEPTAAKDTCHHLPGVRGGGARGYPDSSRSADSATVLTTGGVAERWMPALAAPLAIAGTPHSAPGIGDSV